MRFFFSVLHYVVPTHTYINNYIYWLVRDTLRYSVQHLRPYIFKNFQVRMLFWETFFCMETPFFRGCQKLFYIWWISIIVGPYFWWFSCVCVCVYDRIHELQNKCTPIILHLSTMKTIHTQCLLIAFFLKII